MTISAHIVHEKNGLLARRTLVECPRVGDELRLGESKYLKVTKIVWCLDEETPIQSQRVNIGVLEVDDD